MIVRVDKQFLVACQIGTKVLVWSNSPYDAWRTRKREHAHMVANAVKGELFLFNPVVGQLRQYQI